MKLTKRAWGLILVGIITVGFIVGMKLHDASLPSKTQVIIESEYQDNKTTNQSTEEKQDNETNDQSIEEHQKEVLNNATDKELATEKTLQESFDPAKYKVEVDDIGDAVIITVVMRGTDYTGVSQDALFDMLTEYGMDVKMTKFANMMYETYLASGRDKRILFALSDDNNNVIYAVTNE